MKKLLCLGLAIALGGCLPDPPPPPAPYRALGTEPGWTLLIDNRDLTFIHMDGTQIRQPRPQVINGIAGEIYQTPRINVNIVHATCSDGMSDRVYPDKVQIRVDNRQFDGCGGL